MKIESYDNRGFALQIGYINGEISIIRIYLSNDELIEYRDKKIYHYGHHTRDDHPKVLNKQDMEPYISGLISSYDFFEPKIQKNFFYKVIDILYKA